MDQVLNGQIDGVPPPPPGLAEHWQQLFNRPSFPDLREPRPAEVHHELSMPITAEEVSKAINTTKRDTATGPDGIRWGELAGLSLARLVWGYNTVLYCGQAPASWSRGRTTLIPKKPVPESPGDNRQITVTSLLTRTLNKILASRAWCTVHFLVSKRVLCRRRVWPLTFS